MGAGHENVLFLAIISLFLDFSMEYDILRQKDVKLKISSIKFSIKKILIVEAVNAPVDALRARKKESYYLSKKCKFEPLMIFSFA